MHATLVSAEERRWRRVTTAEEERTVYFEAGSYSRKDPLETVYCKCILTQSTIDNRSCFTIKLLIIMFAFGEGQNSGEGYLEIFLGRYDS